MKFIRIPTQYDTLILSLEHISAVVIDSDPDAGDEQVRIWTADGKEPAHVTLKDAEPLLAALDEYRYTPGFRRGTP